MTLFGYGKLAAFSAAVLFSFALIACSPTEKSDCDHYNDYDDAENQRLYKECLEQVEDYEADQTATSVASKAATATEEAGIATARADYAATNVALDEQLKRSGSSQTLNRARTITGQVSKDSVTATSSAENPVPEISPSPVATVATDSSGTGSADPAPEILPTPADTQTPVPTPVSTTGPVVPAAAPTPVPAPTATPAPVPTATEVPLDLSTLAWLTAHQAAELALLEVDGEIFETAGHGSRSAGVLSSGDISGAELSPGAGYARDWSVTVQNDTEAIFCTIGLGLTNCNNGGFHYGDGEVGTVDADSPAAFARFDSENDPDWQALMAYDNISILLDLHVDLTGAINAAPGDPIERIWSASITVHDEGASLRSGNFHWNVDTDEITSSVF